MPITVAATGKKMPWCCTYAALGGEWPSVTAFRAKSRDKFRHRKAALIDIAPRKRLWLPHALFDSKKDL